MVLFLTLLYVHVIDVVLASR